MKTKRKPVIWLLTVATLTSLWILTFVPQGVGADRAPSSSEIVQRAWKKAREVGVYHFRTELVQTTYPAPSLANVGRTTQRDLLYLEGQVDRPAEAMHLTLWQGGGSVARSTDALEIRIEGDEAHGRTGGGAWQEVDDFSGAFAPGQDLMGYLAAATEVREVGEGAVAPLVGEYARYAFDVDGPAFAAYLRDQLEAQLRRTGELPTGVSLDLSDEVRAATGSGEVWIDERGLPLRLTVRLRYPPQADGRRVEAEVQTDFSRFPPEALTTVRTPAGRFARAIPSGEGWRRMGQQAGFLLGSLACSVALVFVRRTRRLYAAFALTMIVVMVSGPVLQNHHAYAFASEMGVEREAQEERREEQEAAEEYERALRASDWDPHHDPLGTVRNAQYEIPGPQSAVRSPLFALRATDTITNPQADDDGDSLTNLQEWRLGTEFDRDDSDGDGITDQAEVQGFEGGDGQSWYLDPSNPDTDGDGLPDAMECPNLLRASETELSADDSCADLDGDDVPNPFDRDADGDGVPDTVDLSPFSARRSADAPFDEGTPLTFKVEGLKNSGARMPVLVDFQLRPQDSEHLAYAMNVLDWPTGDMDGQIQRVLDTTFATGMTSEERERNPQAANGDLRLVPMLEITMAGDDPPLPTTTPTVDVTWRGEVSGIVHLSQDGGDVRFDFRDWSRSARTYFEIREGSCDALGPSWFGPFSLRPRDDTYTLQDRLLVDFADGAHAILAYEDGADDERTCTTVGNVVNGPWTDEMVNAALLEISGLSVQEKDDDTLVAYVPLTMVEDDLGSARVAFAAHMVYWPRAGGWGNAHEARLVWLVQMLTDSCDDANFTPTVAAEGNSTLYDLEHTAYCSLGAHRAERSQVVHFYDDPWYLTGLEVREDYGIDLAVVHERPAGDDDLDNDDRLWTLAQGLEAAFLSARPDARGTRDFTVETIAERFDVGGSATVTESWGIPAGALDVHLYDETDLPYQDHLGQVPMRIAPEILDAAFLSGGTAVAEAPLLLLAREEHFRGFNLDALGGVSDAARQTLSFDAAGVPQDAVETVAVVQWAPYRYQEGEWAAYPIGEYLEGVLGPRLRETFSQAPEFYDPENDPDAEEALDVEVKAGQSAYVAYYKGLASTVQRGSQVHAQTEFLRTDWEIYRWVKKGWIGSTNAVTRAIYVKVVPEIIDALNSAIDALLARVRYSASERAVIDHLSYFLKTPGGLSPGHVAQRAARISKWAKFKKAVAGAVSSGWDTLTKKVGNLWTKVRANKGLAVIAAVAAVATLVTAIVFAGMGKWEIVLQIALIAVSVVILIKAVYDLVNKSGQAATTTAQAATSAGRSAANAASKATVIAMIIGVVIAFGFLLYTWISSGVRIFSLAFDSMLAQTVAQIYVLTLMFVMALNPVGAVIAAIIGVIDAFAVAVCSIIGEEAQTHAVGQWFCQGLSGLAASAVKSWIYDAHDLVDMREGEDPPRLQIFGFDQRLGTPRWGLSTRNTLKFSLSLTNTIQLAHVFPEWEEMLEGWESGERLIPIDWKSLSYAWMFNNHKLDDATFTYALQTEDADIHEDLSRGTMETEWTATEPDPGKFEIVPFWIVRDVEVAGVTLDETGINRPVSLYLSEGYALPIQECWAVPNPIMLPPGIPLYSLIPVCVMRTNAGTTHIDLGQEMALDVFPADLEEFYDLVEVDGGYSLAWAQDGDHTLARQRDADGDGLVNQRDGGADPDDSTPDADGDGLDDFYEYEAGTPPLDPDADGDGLDDARETRLGTNPYRQDSDGDGLTDLEEVTGWEMVYDITASGQQLRTWVTSDPLTADEDLDGLVDFLEKSYGFHPRVPSSDTILTLDSEVRESSAPRLLYRFEDAPGATAFVDRSGDERAASCAGSSCPTIVAGRYGSALRFDGVDDWVETADVDPGGDFTLAFWLNPESTANGQAFVGKHGPGGGNRVLVGFWNGGYQVNIRGDAHSGGTPTTGWQHIAVVARQTGANSTEVTLYRDGDRLWRETLDAVAGDLTGRPWVLGQEWDGDRTSNFYHGAMDEVALFDYALSRAEARRAMGARYNPNDLIVPAGAAFDYQAAVANELLGRQAQGLLTTDFPPSFAGDTVAPQPFVLHPQEEAVIDGQVALGSVVPSGPISLTQVAGAIITDWREESGFAELWLPLNEASDVTEFQDYSGVTPSRNGTCAGYRCPTRQVPGYFDYGATFDGANDVITLPDAETLGLADGSFTVSAWFSAVDVAGGDQAFLGTDATAADEGLFLGLNDGKLHMGFYGHGLTSNFTPVDDVWYHVAFRYNEEDQEMAIFVQGEPRAVEGGHAAFQGTGKVRLGRGQGGHYFAGTLDDVRAYARALTHGEIRALYSQPVLRMDFEPSGTPGQYLDSSGFGNVALGDDCPTSYYPVRGIRGEGVKFNGEQGCEMLGALLPNMYLNGSAFSWSMWLKPQGSESYPQGILGNYLSYRTTADNNLDYEDELWARSSYPSLLRMGEALRFGFGTGERWRRVDTGDVLTSNRWHHVVVTFGPVYDEDGNFLRNVVDIYVDNELVKSQGVGDDAPHHAFLLNSTITLGRVGERGRVEIDTLTVKDEADGSGKAELCMSWDAEEFYNEGGMEDDDGEGQEYDVSFHKTFQGSGYLRFWEDDDDHDPAGGDRCGPYPDDSDDAFLCTSDEQQKKNKWSCGYRLDTASMHGFEEERLFSSHTTGELERGTWGNFDLRFDNPSVPYYGKMDELVMYKRALSAEEVQELYFSASAALYLPLDEAPGSWSFENTVSLEGQTDAYCAGVTCPTSGVRGREDQAALFDGVDDALTTTLVLDQSSDGPGATLMAWVYPHGAAAGERHVISTRAGRDHRWSLVRSGDKWAFHTGVGLQVTGATVDVGRWQHLALVYDPRTGGASLYKDGVLEFQSVYGITYHATGHPVTIGGRASGGLHFDGLIDEARVFQGALSQEDVETLYRAAPLLRLNLDEPLDAESFADATGNGYDARCNRTGYAEDHCPIAGVEGRMGTGIEFDGQNDALYGMDFGDLRAFTFAAWVKPTARLNAPQPVMRMQALNGLRSAVLRLRADTLVPYLQLRYEDDYTSGVIVEGDTPLILEAWNHVAATYDRDAGRLRLYVNGYQQGGADVPLLPVQPWNLRLGHALNPGTGEWDRFAGGMDEVLLYDRALGPFEVRDLFRYQAKWAEDRHSHRVVVDDEAPTSILASFDPEFPYQPNEYRQKLIEAHDDRSGVTVVELGVQKEGGATTWHPAPRCLEGTAWCPGFDPTSLGGEGTYTLKTRAVDGVGHRETPSGEYTIYVDATPPEVATSVADGSLLAARPHPTRRGAWLVSLSGTATDPLLAGGAPGSGVDRDSIRVTLLDPTGAPAGQEMPVESAGEGWSADYVLTRASTGRYTLRLNASDRVGNVATVDLATFSVDGAAPGMTLDARNTPTGTLAGVNRLRGWASEATLPPNALFRLHFEEDAGAERFYDATHRGHDAACAAPGTCPRAGATGKYGASLAFDGVNDHLIVPDSPDFDLGEGPFALSLWFRQEIAARSDLVTWKNDSGSDVLNVFLTPNGTVRVYLMVDSVGGLVVVDGGTAELDAWHHLALVRAGDALVSYLDGVPSGSGITAADLDAIDEGSELWLGSNHDGGAPLNSLQGRLDEVALFDRALTLAEVRALAQTRVVGVAQPGVAFTPALPGSPHHNAPPPAGEVLHLPFDDVADQDGFLTFVDVSGGERYGACDGAACPTDSADGHLGRAARFDGADDAVTVADAGALTRTTVAVWVYPTGLRGAADLVAFEGAPECGFRLRLKPVRDVADHYRVAFRARVNGAWQAVSAVEELPPGAWSHLAASYDGARLRLYRDGRQIAEVAAPGSIDACAAPLEMGEGFAGRLDEARLFDRALSAAELRALYLGIGPVLHLTLDEAFVTHGDAVPDASGWDHEGTLRAPGTASNRTVPGIVGANALDLDGEDAFVAVPDAPALDLATFSVGGWVYPSSTSPETQVLLTKHDGGAWWEQNYGLELWNHLPRFVFGDCTDTHDFIYASTQLEAGRWNHLMVTYDGAEVRFYLDGALDHSEPVAIAPCQNDAPIEIGGGVAGRSFGGSLDDLRVYPRVLSELEIADLYAGRWRAASTDVGAELTPWSLPVPSGLEGVYRVDLRGRDLSGAHGDSGVSAWQGEVDTLAPRLTFTRTLEGDVYRYTATARDFNLTEGGLLLPCGVPTVTTWSVFESPWYRALGGSYERPYELSATCELPPGATAGEVGAYDTPGLAQNVVLSGTHAYVSDGEAGLLVFDVSDPTEPVLAAIHDTPGTALNASFAQPATFQGAQVVDEPARKPVAASVVEPEAAPAASAPPDRAPVSHRLPVTPASLWPSPAAQPCYAPPGVPSLAPHLQASWDNAITSVEIDPAASQLHSPFGITVTVANSSTTWPVIGLDLCLYFDHEPAPCSGWTGSWQCELGVYLDVPGSSQVVTFTHPGFATARVRDLYAYLDPWCDDEDADPSNDRYGPLTITTGDVFTVTATDPAGNGALLPRDAVISATFSRPLDASTVTSRTFAVYGQGTGFYTGTYAGAVTFDAAPAFKPGEGLRFSLSDELRATDGGILQSYVWEARAAVPAGTAVLTAGQVLTPSGAAPWPIDATLGDLDGDGDLDALITDNNQDGHVWFNDGTGLFTVAGPSLGVTQTHVVALGDLDGDGDLDAFVGRDRDVPDQVWLNDGSGAFTDSGQRLSDVDTCDVALGDLDGDGDLDAFTASGCEGGRPSNKVWRNDGTGAFTSTAHFTEEASTFAVALGDVDHDGDLDAVTGNYGWQIDPSLKLWLNDGDGGFAETSLLEEWSWEARDLALGDLDGDLDLDLVVGTGATHPNTLWLNQGGSQGGVTGTFSQTGQTLALSTTLGIDLGDLDGDGDLDLVVANYDEPDLVFVNDGAGVLVDTGQRLGYNPPPTATFSGDRSTSVALGDLDGDGALDALVSSPASDDGEPTRVWLNSYDSLSPQDDAFTLPEDGGATDLDVRANDAAFNTEALSVVAVSPAANGTTALSGTTAVRYAPAVDFNGADTFTYTVTASGTQTGTAAVTVTVTPVNDPPHFTPGGDPVVAEDAGAQIIAGWAADVRPGPVTALDEAGQAMTFTLTTTDATLFDQQPALDPTGALSFTPAADAHGSSVVTATLQDGGGTANGGRDTVTRTFTVTVTPVNDAPVAQDVARSTPTNAPLTLLLVPTHVDDVDGDALAVGAVGAPAHGAASTDGASATYTPTLGFSGTDAFTYTVRDPGGLTDTGAVTVTVGGANDPPNAIDDLATTPEDTLSVIDVLANDTDPQGQILTVDAVGAAIQGETAIVGNRVHYTPTADFNGTDAFTYIASDGALTDTATVTVTVTPVNDPPTLDAPGDVTLGEDGGMKTVALTGIGTGAADEHEDLTVTAASTDTTLIPHPTVSYASPEAMGTLSFTPVADAFGEATVVVTVTDGLSATARAFRVTVTPVVDGPSLDPLPDLTVQEDPGEQAVPLTGIGVDPLRAGEPVSVSALSGDPPLIPAPTVDYVSPESTGTLRFTPAADAHGTTAISVTVSDGISETLRAFRVEVTPVNDAPTIVVEGLPPDRTLTIPEDDPTRTLTLSGITSGAPDETQTLTVTAETSLGSHIVPHPTVTYTSPGATGAMTFRPLPDKYGYAALTVRVTDGLSETEVLFYVVVEPVNDAPTLDPIGDLTLDEDAPSQTVVVEGISDPEDYGSLTLTAVSTDTTLIPHPTVEYTPAVGWRGWLHFEPAADRWGEARVRVTVRDPGGAEATETFTVTVDSVNDLPTLDPLPDLVADAGAGLQTVALSGITSGAPNEPQALTVTARSGDSGVVPHPGVSYASPAPTGTLTFEPLDRGHVTLAVTVTDGVDAVAREFAVTVMPVGAEPYLYVADGEPGGLRIYEVTGPGTLHFVGAIDGVRRYAPGLGWYHYPVDARDVAARGGHAYVAGGDDGLWVMDVIDPAHPRYLAQLSPAGTSRAVAVALSADTLYLLDDGSRQLTVVDVTDPSAPAALGTYAVPCLPYDVAAHGDHLFLADQCGLRVLDATTPADPRQVGYLPLSGARDVTLVGGMAYVANGRGLALVDVLHPLEPTLVRRFDTPGHARSADSFVAELEGDFHTMACVADLDEGLRVINTDGVPVEEATACDTAGNCRTVSLARRQTQAKAGAPAALETTILSPDPVLASTDAVSFTGNARALSATLRSLAVTVDGVPVHGESWAAGTLSATTWSTAWTPPGEGRYVLRAEILDWAGDTAQDALTVLVDARPPALAFASTVLTRTHYRTPRSLLLTGPLSDTGGVESAAVTVDGGGEVNAELTAGTWRAPWYLGPGALPDGETFTLTVRATDVVGRRTAVTETLWVDLVPPSEVDATLAPPSSLIRAPGAPLTLTWGAAADGSGLSGYGVVWTAADILTTTVTSQTFATSDARQATFAAGEAQRVAVELVARDAHGNVRRQEVGARLIDGPTTPDYIPLTAGHWRESGCTLLGADRRDHWRGPQRLYATWNSGRGYAGALRLAWTGATWNSDGDLFVTFDTAPGGATTAFNPYTETVEVTLPRGMEADHVVWVRDEDTAELWAWDGAAWAFTAALTSGHLAVTGHRTDLYLPFDLLGIADPGTMPLKLLAFATEEGAPALWSVLPAANGVNSPVVVEDPSFADTAAPLALDHAYGWDALGDGVCPNGSDGSLPHRHADTDLHLSLDADPAGTSYGLLDDGLYWLRDLLESDPADVTSHLDFMATAHPPLGHGQALSYTLRFENRGTVTATGVVAELTPRYALHLPGGTTVALGDVAPGGRGSVTVPGVVDATAAVEPWAALEARVYDDGHPVSGSPLEWLWAYHAVDRAAPVFYGLQVPERYVGPRETLLRGYAFDEGGVAGVTLGVDSPAGGSTTLVCDEDAPWQGSWYCLWNLVVANGGTPPAHGDAFHLYLRATDPFGQDGAWSAPYTLVVDSLPPTLTLTSDLHDGELLADAGFTLAGSARDGAGPERVELCVDDLCEGLTLRPGGAPVPLSYEDAPETPPSLGAITPCGGAGLNRSFTVDEEMTLGAVRLGFAACHAHRDDLRVTLTSPSGTTVTLLGDDGLSGTTLADYDLLLSDAAPSSYAAPVPGDVSAPRYDRAARPLEPLDAFRGEEGQGTWTLTVCDADPGSNDGAYLSSRLILVSETTAALTGHWTYEHSELTPLDYVSRTLRLYATDGVGNRTTHPPGLTLWIDNVPPVLTVTQVVTRVLAGRGDVALQGLVTDGGEARAVRATVETPSGRRYDDLAARDGNAWSLTLAENLALALPGEHRIWLTALDEAGNSATLDPVTVTVSLPPVTSPPQHLYLPQLSRDYRAQAPDFRVRSTEDVLLSTDVMLELENAGNAAATVPIRVDLYFDPDHVPGEGDPWDALATYGAHWTVPTARLPGAGEALTLRLADAEGARYPPSFVGLAHAYVRVDTLSVVPELDEGNNLMQIDLPDLDGPDLVVAEFVATGDGVQIVLENVGEGVVSDPFWVDLYVDPHPAPTRVNQIWEDLAEAGAVWGVTEGALPLRTGDALTLTVDGPYFRAEYGHLDLPLAVGTPVYVQVDSANAGTLYGGVLEYHELVGGAYNNIASTTVVAGRGLSPMRERGSPGGGLPDVLPARP